MISILNLIRNNKKGFRWICLACILISIVLVLSFKIFIPFSNYDEIMLDRILLSPNEEYYVEVRTLRKINSLSSSETDKVELKHSYVVLSNNKNEREKIIYYGNEELSELDVKWIDDYSIQIKNHVLKVPYDVYDYRIHVWK
ncbi:MAG: DUF5412 family protein [Turicibacter sp.]|nr:MAG TPA: protein of unknown function (DUF5412) [Caudoviricetes sp.]